MDISSPQRDKVGPYAPGAGSPDHQWLMSPGLSGLMSPQGVPTSRDISFSPSLFSPGPSAHLVHSHDSNGSFAQLSPSIFSPAGSKVLKKRNFQTSPLCGPVGNSFYGSVSYFRRDDRGPEVDEADSLQVGHGHGDPRDGMQLSRRNRLGRNIAEEEIGDGIASDFLSGSTSSSSSSSTSRGSQGHFISRTNSKASRRISPAAFFSPPASHGGSGKNPRLTSPPSEGSVGNPCNCKKSKCLKLYCECFAALKYCESCNCLDCYNNKLHDDARAEAIKVTKDRNASAFQSKVTSAQGHATGCNCKNSLCLKKYCECFQGGAFCAKNCKCVSCQNFEGSAALESIYEKMNEKKRKGSPSSVACASLSDNGTPPTDDGSDPQSPLDGTEGAGVRSYRHRPSRPSSTPLSAPAGLSASAPSSYLRPGSDAVVGERRSSRQQAKLLAEQEASRLAAESTACSSALSMSSVSSSAADADHDMIFTVSPILSPSLGSEMLSSQRKRVKFTDRQARERDRTVPTYPFFGIDKPEATKLTALRCVEYLDGKSIYALSLVSTLWNRAAMDNSLWE